MTTVAANRRSMAADTQVTGDGYKYHTIKLFEIGESIIGVSGDAENTMKFVEWFRLGKPSEKPDFTVADGEDKGIMVLELNSRGLFLYNGATEPDRLIDKFFAVGSGSGVAIHAMQRGDSPAQAVRAAHKVDPSTGSKVIEMSLPHPRRTAKRRKGPDVAKQETPDNPGHANEAGSEAGPPAVGGPVRSGKKT